MTRSALFCLFCACQEQVFGKKMFSLAGLKNDFCNNSRAVEQQRCFTKMQLYGFVSVTDWRFICPKNSWIASGVPGFHTA